MALLKRGISRTNAAFPSRSSRLRGELLLDELKLITQQYPKMFRTPAIFLLATFLSLGSTFFERIHLGEVNRAIASIPAPKIASHSPLKRVPVKPPIHDPSTCVICLTLHASVTAQAWSIPSLDPAARIGFVAPELRTTVQSHPISCDHCRGPPVA
jgi:hypothetical protein